MRLTLRTLLAYLDDVLSPADAREIGQKVAESEHASRQVSRIREVMRQRRLTAPEVIGPASGIDPNLVAEYLDNLLTPEQNAEIEQICLDSDMHVAEVAASHQILTLVVGDPVQIEQNTRERMYALGPNSAQLVADVAEEQPVAQAESAPPAASPVVASRAESGSFQDRIPDYLREKDSNGKVWLIGLVAIVLVAWVGTVFYDNTQKPNGDAGQTLAQNAPTTPPGTDAAGGNGTGTEPPVVPNPLKDPDAELPVDPAPPEDGTGTNGGTGVDTNPPIATTLPDGGTPAVTDTGTNLDPGNGGEMTKPDTPEEVASIDKPEEGKPPVDPVPEAAGPVVEAEYRSQEGILLHEVEDKQGWFPLARRSLIRPGERLVTPVPFTSVVSVGEDVAITLTMHGGSRLRMLAPAEIGEDGVAGFELETGEIEIEARNLDAADEEVLDLDAALQPPVEAAAPVDPKKAAEGATSIVIKIGEHRWLLHLRGVTTRIGMAVEPAPAPQPGVPLGPNWYTGLIGVHSGEMVVIDPAMQGWSLNGSELRRLRPGQDAALEVVSSPRVSTEWFDPARHTVSPVIAQRSRQFEDEFIADLSASQSVAPLIKNGSPNEGSWAAETLIVLQNIPELAKALFQAQYPEARLTAANGIREWLPLSKENVPTLRKYLALNFEADNVEILTQLLTGITEAEAMTVPVSQNLVNWLRHPIPIIRELSIAELKRLVGKDNGYQPSAPQASRERAILRWQNLLKSQQTLLKKEE